MMTRTGILILFNSVLLIGLGTCHEDDDGFGVFNGVGSVLSKLGDLFDSAQPYIRDGLQMARRAEQWVDSVIAEECIYSCPSSSQIPVPRPGYKPTSNGCGSGASGIFDNSDESLIKVEKGFTKCCNKHDLCYDTCNSDKDMCDIDFKKCLYGQCRGGGGGVDPLSFIDTKTCRLKAKLFFVTVIGVGCQAYLDAQATACQCIPKNRASTKGTTKNEL